MKTHEQFKRKRMSPFRVHILPNWLFVALFDNRLGIVGWISEAKNENEIEKQHLETWTAEFPDPTLLYGFTLHIFLNSFLLTEPPDHPPLKSPHLARLVAQGSFTEWAEMTSHMIGENLHFFMSLNLFARVLVFGRPSACEHCCSRNLQSNF